MNKVFITIALIGLLGCHQLDNPEEFLNGLFSRINGLDNNEVNEKYSKLAGFFGGGSAGDSQGGQPESKMLMENFDKIDNDDGSVTLKAKTGNARIIVKEAAGFDNAYDVDLDSTTVTELGVQKPSELYEMIEQYAPNVATPSEGEGGSQSQSENLDAPADHASTFFAGVQKNDDDSYTVTAGPANITVSRNKAVAKDDGDVALSITEGTNGSIKLFVNIDKIEPLFEGGQHDEM